MSTNQIRIYACGGAGVNILGKNLGLFEKHTDGMSEYDIAFLDTSMSNLKHLDRIDLSSIYIFKGRDGSGGLRSMNYEAIIGEHGDVLTDFKPSQVLNIVVHSASGGSGSVIGPVIASELIKRGLPVMVLLIGSTSSRIEVNNTIKVITGYDVMAQMYSKPVLIHYLENSSSQTRSMTDASAISFISVMSLFFSGVHQELDSSDLLNFMDYTVVTPHQPKAVMIEVYEETVVLEGSEKVYSALSIAKEDCTLGCMVDYHAVGYMNNFVAENMTAYDQIHAITVDGRLQIDLGRLSSLEAKYGEESSLRTPKSLASKDAVSSSDSLGIIL